MRGTDKSVLEASLSCAMLFNIFLTPLLMGKVLIEVHYKIKGINKNDVIGSFKEYWGIITNDWFRVFLNTKFEMSFIRYLEPGF